MDDTNHVRQSAGKGCEQLVAEANAAIRTYTAAEAITRYESGGTLVVDVRDGVELSRHGRIPGSVHASRGMLEFHLDPESPYAIEALSDGRELLIHCAVGSRSALATRTAREMGFENVANVAGGFEAWKAAGGPVETAAPSM